MALLAGVEAGVLPDLGELAQQRTLGAQLFTPTLDAEERQRWCTRWDNAVRRSLHWSEGEQE